MKKAIEAMDHRLELYIPVQKETDGQNYRCVISGLDPAASYELPVQIHLPPGSSLHATAEPQSVKATFLAP